jgi:hypothetical protein
MKARPIIPRNNPLNFPLLAKWENGSIKPLIILFVADKIGYVVRPTYDGDDFQRGHWDDSWFSLKGKYFNGQWKILGSPNDFGISLVNEKIIGEFKER